MGVEQHWRGLFTEAFRDSKGFRALSLLGRALSEEKDLIPPKSLPSLQHLHRTNKAAAMTGTVCRILASGACGGRFSEAEPTVFLADPFPRP